MEQFFFAEEIKNIVSSKGLAKVEGHEKIDEWWWRMSQNSLQAMPVKVISETKQWLGKINAREVYTIMEEKGYLVLGWKSKLILASSCRRWS